MCKFVKKYFQIFILYIKQDKRRYNSENQGDSSEVNNRDNENEVLAIPRFVSRKKVLFLTLLLLCVLFIISIAIYNKSIVYEYSYNGVVLGVVKHGNHDFEKILPDTEKQSAPNTEKLKTPNGAEIVINKERSIKVNKIHTFKYKKKDLDTKKDIIRKITTYENVEVRGYNFIINETVLGTLSSEEEGAKLLERIKDLYLGGKDRNKFKSMFFIEEVFFQEVRTTAEKIVSADKIFKSIAEGAIKLGSYQVKLRETVFDIAFKYDMKVERLEELNSVIDIEYVQVGDVLQVESWQPLISLVTTETEQYEADEDYDIIYQDSNELYIDQEKVKAEGKLGTRLVTAEITKINGIEIERKEMSSVITKPAVSKVILRGTKKRPVPVSKGQFIWPANARVTSEFGPRWGRLHRGIDIGIRYGKVVAADGGKVVIAGNQHNSYGNAIKIDHGNGRATLYAHLNTIDVKVGDKVYQGQRIATSGNTGRSTGPHLHFEVHINGVQRNPRNFLK